MPSGKITQNLINDYKIGISTVMMVVNFSLKKNLIKTIT